ncbi:MAG: GTPase [Nanoarchaeota archaeon]
MAKQHYWGMVDDVIRQSDVVLEVLDARLIAETRNAEIEKRIEKMDKKLIHVVNKIDLIDKELIRDQVKGLSNPVYVSSKERLGTTILKTRIMEVGRKDIIVVGVVGYPNTGKSSVINALCGSTKARSSPTSGFTRGIQKVKAGYRIVLLDTPGVIPIDDQDIVRHALIGSKNAQNIKEPDLIAIELIRLLKGRIEKHYGVEPNDDPEVALEKIAVKLNRLKKGGVPDVDAVSRTIIMDWQRGRI